MDASTVFQRMVWATWLALGMTTSGITADTPAPSATLVNAGTAPQQVFTYKFTPGLYSHYSVEQNQVVKTEYAEGNQQVVQQMLAQKNFRVVSVETDGGATLEPLIRQVRMTARFDETDPIVFDSRDENAEVMPQFRGIKSTVGRPVARMKFSPSGQLLKITPLQGAPEQLNEIAAKADPTANFLIVFPQEPIGVGAIWREKFSVPVKLSNNGVAPPVPMQREYQLTKIEGNIATISLKTAVLMPLNDPQVEAALLTRQLTGTMEFDTSLGLLVSHNTRAAGRVVGAFGPKTAMTSSIETKEKRVISTDGVQPATLKEIGAAN